MIDLPLTSGQKLDIAFHEFDQANPHVYRMFRDLAVKVKVRGHNRWGAKSLWEVLRWELAINTRSPVDQPKLNNSYVSRYARKLVLEDPEEWEGFFEMRKLRKNTNA